MIMTKIAHNIMVLVKYQCSPLTGDRSSVTTHVHKQWTKVPAKD